MSENSPVKAAAAGTFIKRIFIILALSAVTISSLSAAQICAESPEPEELHHEEETYDAAPVTGSSIDVARSKGWSIDQRYAPAGSIITEINTGQILWTENRNVEWTPASMSKLMTIALTYDAIRDGKLSLETEVAVTEKYVKIAENSKLSNNNMQLGCVYTVSELIDIVVVPSSAAATYMLADLLAPDIDTFVKMLNDKAAELNMVNTRYVNPIGVLNYLLEEYAPEGDPDDDNYSSPQDYACLCTYLVTNYPDLLNHTKYAEIVVKEGTEYEETFHGYNHSLEGAEYAFPGADGIKTGSARNGYNYSMTAKRGDTRMIEIVMGVSTWEDTEGEFMRHPIGNAILGDAFNTYEYRKILDAGVYVIDGKTIKLSKPLYDCVPKDWKPDFVCDFESKTISAKFANREYLPGFSAPKADVEIVKTGIFDYIKDGIAHPGKLVILLIVILLITVASTCIRHRKRASARRYRRRR